MLTNRFFVVVRIRWVRIFICIYAIWAKAGKCQLIVRDTIFRMCARIQCHIGQFSVWYVRHSTADSHWTSHIHPAQVWINWKRQAYESHEFRANTLSASDEESKHKHIEQESSNKDATWTSKTTYVKLHVRSKDLTWMIKNRERNSAFNRFL